MVTVKPPKNWRNVVWEPAWVLAFDASMANTGWALVRFSPSSYIPRISLTGTIRTGRDDGSNDSIKGSLERGDLIYREACTVFEAIHIDDLFVVHELPAMQTMVKQVRKAEGGPISAMAVRAAALAHGYEPLTVHGTTMKRLVTGDGKATKQQVGEAVVELFRFLTKSNEHIRDALGLAVAWMLNEKKWIET